MREIDESLFASLRVITIMLNMDGVVHAAETKWFRRLLERFEVSPQQMKILERDLKSPPDLYNLVPQISVLDREQLLSWLRAAMNIDGSASQKEKMLFNSVRPLLESDDIDLADSHREAALGLIGHTKRIQAWKELKEAADFYRQARTFFWGFWIWPMRVPLGNRYIRWAFFIFVVVPLAMQLLFYFIRYFYGPR